MVLRSANSSPADRDLNRNSTLKCDYFLRQRPPLTDCCVVRVWHALLCCRRVLRYTLVGRKHISAKKRKTEMTGPRNPFRTAVPFWGQTTRNLTGSSPKRDCGSKRLDPKSSQCQSCIEKWRVLYVCAIWDLFIGIAVYFSLKSSFGWGMELL